MKRILLSGTMLLAGMSAMNAVEPVKDPAAYTSVNGTHLQSLWMYSPKTGNILDFVYSTVSDNRSVSRGMALSNGKLYFSNRKTGTEINVVNAKTGVFEQKYVLPKEVNGYAPGLMGNDLHNDSHGNLVIGNICSDLQKVPLVLWRMRTNAIDQPEELMRFQWDNFGLEGSLRVDCFDIYGDAYGDGYIIAAIAGIVGGFSNMVLKWNITGGVVDALPTPLIISAYVPSSTKLSGTAPRVRAINADGFYLDPSNAHASYYSVNDGTILDYFDITKTVTKFAAANGVDEFTLGGKTYLVAGTNNHGDVTGISKNSFELFDITNSMQSADPIFLFPANGLGDDKNTAMSVNPLVEKVDDETVNIYCHAADNGIAAYRFSLKPLSVDAEKMSAMNIHLAGSELVFSEEAAKVDVYAVAGNCVAQFANVNRANLSLVKGIYIVKAMDMAGKTKVQKIVVE